MRRTLFTVSALLLLASMLVFVSPATAAVLTVTDCGDTTPGGAPGQLRRLISDATPGDTITVPACLITLTGTPDEDANAGGDLDIGKNLTIRGAGARRTVIDGGAVDRVFDILAPATVTLSDAMVRNGSGQALGGGIRNAGTLTLNRVVVRGNLAAVPNCSVAVGGGIANNGVLIAVETSIEGNAASGCKFAGAGGISNHGALTLRRSAVIGNGVNGSQSNIGGIQTTGTLTLVDSTVAGNDGGINGPGGISNSGTLSAIGSAVLFNASVFALVNGIDSSGPATLANTLVANNGASRPGASQCGGVTSLGGNLTTDASCGAPATGDAVAGDVGLGPLGDHGGITPTFPLLPGSPAIDTALPGFCTPRDQRGQSRPQDGNGDTTAVCDKGPFELTPPIFADVPADHFGRGAMEALFVNGVTGGCLASPHMFCPEDLLTRGQIAVLLLRAVRGAGFEPPPATGVFADVPAGHPFAPWIEALYSLLNLGITSDCGASPRRFCLDGAVPRGQLAVLLLRVLAVPGFVPPAATGIFVDVASNDPFAPWIEELFRRGIATGCPPSPSAFCPNDAATRGQTAVLLVRAFGFGF